MPKLDNNSNYTCFLCNNQAHFVSFNAKNYDVAYENVKNAGVVEDFVAAQGFT